MFTSFITLIKHVLPSDYLKKSTHASQISGLSSHELTNYHVTSNLMCDLSSDFPMRQDREIYGFKLNSIWDKLRK